MAGENLIYTFGGDASKLNAEIKFVGQNLKQLDREISAAFKSGNIAQARQLSDVSGTLQTKFVGLNRELKGTAAGLDQVSAAGGRMRLQFRNLGGSIETIAGQLGRLRGGFVGGLIGGAVISGVREVTKALDDQIERIVKIRDLARDTARSPASVAAAQNVARAAGESTDDANRALQKQSQNFAELERRRIGTIPSQSQEAQAKREELIQQRARLLGGGAFSEKDAAIELSKIYEILVVDVARFKGNAEAAANFVDKSFLQLVSTGKYSATQLNEIAKQLYDTNKDAAIKIATANIEKYNAELAKTSGTTNTAVSDAEKLAVAQGKLENQFNESSAGITSYYTNLKTASAEAATQLLKGTWTDALIEVGKLQNAVIGSLGKSVSGALKGRPQGMPDTADQMQGDFKDLPNFFEGIGKTIGDVWKATFGSIIGSAQAAEVKVSASAKGMSASFVVAAKDIQNAMSAALGAVNSLQGAASMAQGAASFAAGARAGGGGDFGVQVFRGGIGDQGGHGPASFATQSIRPGLSDYQATPAHGVSPIDYSAAMGWESAATSAKDAAIASQTAAEASRLAVQGWVDPGNTKSFASGGMIRGAGSGTSDSIMARLSNGEFVMRAAAVRHWGPRFLSSLNGFAGGGMVMPSRGVPSFAGGGMVHAGVHGGAVVNLNFPGGSFSLYGDNETVGALTREARRAGMLQGGRPAGVLQ